MTMVNPLGKRFSHVYISQGEAFKDSKKARFRIAKLAEDECPPSRRGYNGNYTFNHAEAAQGRLERALGLRFATKAASGTFIKNWEWFFNRVIIIEFLASVTVISQYLHESGIDPETRFLRKARAIFKEKKFSLLH